MPGGPIVVFVKSALQSFSADESVLFDNFYLPVVTPLFPVETLADLDKKVREGQTLEQPVGIIAAKTPVMCRVSNAHHLRLARHESPGHLAKMDQRPVVAEGRRVITADGREIVIENWRETDALQRWQEGSLLEIETPYPRRWRAEFAHWNPGHGQRFRAVEGTEARVSDCRARDWRTESAAF